MKSPPTRRSTQRAGLTCCPRNHFTSTRQIPAGPGVHEIQLKQSQPFWQGKPSDEVREHSVGLFAVRNRLLGSITPPAEGAERILSLRLQTSSGPVSLISAYAPTLASTAEAKDKFYDDLSAAISRISDRELLFIAGDFNARVGVNHNWPTCLGQFGIGKMHENGQHLLELCCHHGLCVSNTICNTKPLHRVSWRHPRSEHWHQLDLILTRRAGLSSIKDSSQLPERRLWH